MATDVLIIGSGGREHALAWKLKQSSKVGKLYIAPGNAGTAALGENVAISAKDINALVNFADEKHIGLTVVGPDDPLALGIVDAFRLKQLRVFGPTKEAAQVESSKSFAKKIMEEGGVPTAPYRTFSSYTPATQYAQSRPYPLVVKAAGLALGKGVHICGRYEEADKVIRDILVGKIHGDAGNEVVIEDYLTGFEISVHTLTDTYTYLLFPAAQDHKRALDGDMGENTGGMGTIAPVPQVTREMMQTIERTVMKPTLDALGKRALQFTGLLFPGIMVTSEGPNVLEYNARFGDPETQTYMRLLKSDLFDVLFALADGTFTGSGLTLEWNEGFAATIILASGGYPGSYQSGFPITGIAEAEAIPGVVVFYAGVERKDGTLVTAGGRVLGVSAVGRSLEETLLSAYRAVELIHFEGKQFRKDIGAKSL